VEVGAALGKLVDALDGATVCVEVGAALGKLVVETRSAWNLDWHIINKLEINYNLLLPLILLMLSSDSAYCRLLASLNIEDKEISS
jgi:hypothetical protein